MIRPQAAETSARRAATAGAGSSPSRSRSGLKGGSTPRSSQTTICVPGEAMRAAARSSAVLDDSARRLPEIARILIESTWDAEAAHEQLGARRDPVRGVDRLDVAMHRLRADAQLRGHLLLRRSRQQAAQDVAFPRRETRSAARPPRRAVAERQLLVEQLEQVLV